MKKFWFLLVIFTLTFGVGVNADLGDRVLKKGMSGYDVNTLQRYLKELGYFHEEEFTNYFGPITEEAVKQLQEDHEGLEIDGIVGKSTSKYINSKVSQIYFVRDLATSAQKDLKELGYYTGEITAEIDEATILAIKAFQEKEGFEVTGELDKITQDKLNELFPKKKEEKGDVSSRALIDFAKRYLGTRYSYGGTSSRGFDCSGFSTFVMKNYGITLDRRASEQARKGTPVDKANLKVGDLVFFSQTGKKVDHVGIYIGSGNFIHASSYRRGVVVDNFSKYTGVYMGARRYLNVEEE